MYSNTRLNQLFMDGDELIKWTDDGHTYVIRELDDLMPIDPWEEMYTYTDSVDIYNLDYHYTVGSHETHGFFDTLALIVCKYCGYREDDPAYDFATDPEQLSYMTRTDALKCAQDVIGNDWTLLPLSYSDQGGSFAFHRPFFTLDYDGIAVVKAHDVVCNYDVAADMSNYEKCAYDYFFDAIELYRLYLSGECYTYDVYELINDHFEWIDNSGTCYGYNLFTNGAICYGLDKAIFNGEYETMELTPVVSYKAVSNDGGVFSLLYV